MARINLLYKCNLVITRILLSIFRYNLVKIIDNNNAYLKQKFKFVSLQERVLIYAIHKWQMQHYHEFTLVNLAVT